jgi:uncharacterized membrane protein
MGWKDLPLWLKVGIIFSVSFFALACILLFVGFINAYVNGRNYFSGLQGLVVYYFIFAFVGVLTLVVIDKIIRFIIGKIKNRNK